MSFWNEKYLQPPPITTYKTSAFIGINLLKHHFNEALKYFGNLQFLEKEAALLSRCIYRMKTKFRSDKGLKTMEKLNRSLVQYNYLKFKNILEDFHSLLPEDVSDIHLPSRNMLDYILVRLQGITHLMYRITETAKITASHMGSRLCIGQFWKIGLIMLALVSRIWILSKDIVKECCKFYKNILPMRNKLQNIGNNWLPEDYIFPDNLEEWVGIDGIVEDDAPKFNLLKTVIPTFDVVDDSDVEECGEYINVEDEDIINIDDVTLKTNDKAQQLSMFDLLMKTEDLGEIVSEVDFQKSKNNFKETLITKNKTNKKKKKKNDNKLNTKLHEEKHINFKDTCINNNLKGRNKILDKEKPSTSNKVSHKENKNVKMNKANNNIQPKLSKKQKKKQRFLVNQIDNLDSIQMLKKFMINENNKRESPDPSSSFFKMDKLQWAVLQKRVKKYTKKVKNNVITECECLKQVKVVLKTNL